MDVVVWTSDDTVTARDIVEALTNHDVSGRWAPVAHHVRGVKVISRETGKEIDRWGQVE